MNKSVAGFLKGFSNESRRPYVLARLECGHYAEVQFTIEDAWGREHDESIYKTKVGDSASCERCDWFDNRMDQLRAMQPGDISHSRFRPTDSRGGSEGSYDVYGHDKTSPTGVRHMFSIEANKESNAELCRISASALSPTEKR